MTHNDAGDYSRKHTGHEKLDAVLTDAVQKAAEKGRISCAAVFKIVVEFSVKSADAGLAVDQLNIKLVACQLGLFGHSSEREAISPAEKVSPDLAAAIRDNLVDGQLPCERAWKLADDWNVKKMDVSRTAEALNIRIKPCQLGAF